MDIQIDQYKGYDIKYVTNGTFFVEKEGDFIDGNFDNSDECKQMIDDLGDQ